MVKNRKKDNIDLICEELTKYNEQHGTSYSYGEYTALVGMGKIKSKNAEGTSFVQAEAGIILACVLQLKMKGDYI